MVQTLLTSVEVAMDVPVILQRRLVATVQCLRLSSSPEFVDILLRNSGWYACGGDEG